MLPDQSNGVKTVEQLWIEDYIAKKYSVTPDNPWKKFENYKVFHHNENKKWFALVMNVPKNRLGLNDDGILNVVNLKCDSILIGSIRRKDGVFPAYHMNKEKWITVALDGSVSKDIIKMLLDVSYNATAPYSRQRQHKGKITEK